MQFTITLQTNLGPGDLKVLGYIQTPKCHLPLSLSVHLNIDYKGLIIYDFNEAQTGDSIVHFDDKDILVTDLHVRSSWSDSPVV